MPSVKITLRNPKTISVDAPGGAEYWQQIHALGMSCGLDALGVADANSLDRALAQLNDRIDRGLTNGMNFTFLNPERSTNPGRHLEQARSIIVGVRSYAINHEPEMSSPESPLGRIAQYAWIDHYGELKASLTNVASRLRLDGHRAVVYADDNSIVDREVAWKAGLGWFGKNANILLPGSGSFYVIGCVITTADLPIGTTVSDGCGTCSRCITACPTQAIIEPGVIDSNRCLSWLLQKPGVFDPRFREALGDRIYGCDDCQTVCPITKRAELAPDDKRIKSTVRVLDYLDMDDSQLNTETERWYVHKRNMTWVRRNLLIVLGNIGVASEPRTLMMVKRYLANDQGVLRAHAVWAAARLGLVHLIDYSDQDDLVRAELADLPPMRADL